MLTFTRRYPVIIFAALILALSFAAYWLLPLPVESKALAFPITIAFIPTLVATALVAVLDGRAGLRDLYGTFRIGKPLWLLIGAAIGLGLQVAMALAAVALGWTSSLAITTSPALLALAVATPIFALGEEIGWRGFAARHLLKWGHTPLTASLITGIPWALVHFSLFLPGMMFVERPLILQVAPIAMFAFLHTWVLVKSRGGILAPALLHGFFNTLGAALNSGLGVDQAAYLGAGSLVASALICLAADWTWWSHPLNPPGEPTI